MFFTKSGTLILLPVLDEEASYRILVNYRNPPLNDRLEWYIVWASQKELQQDDGTAGEQQSHSTYYYSLIPYKHCQKCSFRFHNFIENYLLYKI